MLNNERFACQYHYEPQRKCAFIRHSSPSFGSQQLRSYSEHSQDHGRCCLCLVLCCDGNVCDGHVCCIYFYTYICTYIRTHLQKHKPVRQTIADISPNYLLAQRTVCKTSNYWPRGRLSNIWALIDYPSTEYLCKINSGKKNAAA